MWHRSKAAALASGLRRIAVPVDPDMLLDRARHQGVTLPFSTEHVSSPTMAMRGQGGGIGYQVLDADLSRLRDAVERLTA